MTKKIKINETQKGASDLVEEYLNGNITKEYISELLNDTSLDKHFRIFLNMGIKKTKDGSMTYHEATKLGQKYHHCILGSRLQSYSIKNEEERLSLIHTFMPLLFDKVKSLENSNYVSDNEIEFLKAIPFSYADYTSPLSTKELVILGMSKESPYFDKPVTDLKSVFNFKNKNLIEQKIKDLQRDIFNSYAELVKDEFDRYKDLLPTDWNTVQIREMFLQIVKKKINLKTDISKDSKKQISDLLNTTPPRTT